MADGGVLRRGLCGDEFESRIADSAIAAGGYVLKLINTGNVDLAGANENSYGISVKSTKEWVGDGMGGGTWTAQSGVPVLIQREGEALVQLLATNQVIAIGDPLMTTAGGTVDLGSWTASPTLTELRSLVGIANEAKGASAGGVINTILNILRL